MLSPFAGFSLRHKLSLLVAAVVAVAFVFLEIYVPSRIVKNKRHSLETHARVCAAMLTSAMAKRPQGRDQPELEELLRQLTATSDLAYGVARLADGTVLVGLNLDRAPKLQTARASGPSLTERDNVLHVVTPMALHDQPPGTLQLGFSLASLDRDVSTERWLLAAVLLLLLVFGIGGSLVIATQLTRPLTELTHIANNIATQGDLDQEIAVHASDEVGQLAESFRDMMAKLRTIPANVGGAAAGVVEVVDRVAQTAKSVGEGASIVSCRIEETSASVGQMLSILRGIGENVETLNRNAEDSATSNSQMLASNDNVSKQMAEMARAADETTGVMAQITSWIRQISGAIEELNSSVESTSVSMSEMDAAIGEVEANASETAKLSGDAAETSGAGVRSIKQTIAGIDRIRQSSSVVAKLIESLGARLSHIGDIVVVIDTVAGQTNLLALNAAIIAAQAGEHGRGFAVVADEIKALATRTAASTQEIRALIEGIEEESTKAVSAVEETERNIADGVRLGGAAEQALTQISEATEQATNMVRAIAISTVEQARASRQVTTSIHRIAESIQRINLAAREQARSSERVGEVVRNMQSITQAVLHSSEEQRDGAGQTAVSVENISRMAKTLAQAQKEQTLGAAHVLKAIDTIREVTLGQDVSVRDLEAALTALQHHATTLSTTMRQFRA